jgi:hypothetical protein
VIDSDPVDEDPPSPPRPTSRRDIARPLAAKHPSLTHVIEVASNQLVPTAPVIGEDLGQLVVLRDQILRANARGEPLYRCSYCKHPVYIRAHTDQRHQHFAHLPGPEEDRCPAATARQLYTLDQLSAMQFRGKQEGALHKRLVSLVFHSLIADPRFSDVRVGPIVKHPDGTWRRPDVDAIYHGQHGPQSVVFEIQLARTAARVMAERKEFYAKRDTVLIWILDSYDTGWQSLMKQHAFYPNRRNALWLNDETLAATRANRAFKLRCYWEEPTSAASVVSHQQLIGFDDLTLDPISQQAFYFDYEKVAREVEEQSQLREEKEQELDRRDVIRSIRAWHTADDLVGDERNRLFTKWDRQRARVRGTLGIELPDRPSDFNSFWLQTRVVLTIFSGKVIGTRHVRTIDFVHYVLTQQTRQAWLLLVALRAYGGLHQLIEEDSKHKLRCKLRDKAIPGLRDADAAWRPDRKHAALLTFLFPGTADDFLADPATTLSRWLDEGQFPSLKEAIAR